MQTEKEILLRKEGSVPDRGTRGVRSAPRCPRCGHILYLRRSVRGWVCKNRNCKYYWKYWTGPVFEWDRKHLRLKEGYREIFEERMEQKDWMDYIEV